jgi:dienelactone hydrolase
MSTEGVEMAREFAARLGDQSPEAAAALLTEDGRQQVADSFPEDLPDDPDDAAAVLDAYWHGLYCQYGEFEAVDAADGDAGDAAVDEGGTVAVELRFEDGSEVAEVTVDDGGVTGLSVAPTYEAPDYVDRRVFSERDVTVDADGVELDGTLAVPEGDGPVPGVVFVHGRGIHDPDGTAGTAKILRDFAWGLASEGVASLRYEKRLNDHEVPDEAFTVDRVVVDDAVAAAERLAATDEVGPVFVAGHSQGGMCAPRIAEQYGDAAGVVVLDGTADTFLDPDDLTPIRYEMDPEGDIDDEQEAELESMREAFRRAAEADVDPGETVAGRPGAWHPSLREYDPAGTAAALDAPAFVAGTGRVDHETQADLFEWLRDRFATWEGTDLPTGSRTEFYGEVGHYFQAGPAPISPVRLYFGGNVADHVVEDLAAWIQEVADG